MSASPSRRSSRSREFRRIQEKGVNVTHQGVPKNTPNDFNKENRGSINYDPRLGWVAHSTRGGENVGKDIKSTTNHLRRGDGLPGSRP